MTIQATVSDPPLACTREYQRRSETFGFHCSDLDDWCDQKLQRPEGNWLDERFSVNGVRLGCNSSVAWTLPVVQIQLLTSRGMGDTPGGGQC